MKFIMFEYEAYLIGFYDFSDPITIPIKMSIIMHLYSINVSRSNNKRELLYAGLKQVVHINFNVESI